MANSAASLSNTQWKGVIRNSQRGVVAVGARDAAVEGGELSLGQVAGDLEVVEGVIVRVGDKVDEIEAGEHVPSEPGPVGQDAPEEQDEQRVVQPGRQGYPPPRCRQQAARAGQRPIGAAPFTVRRSRRPPG